MKKLKFNLTNIMMMLVMVVFVSSCGDLSDHLNANSITEGPAEPEPEVPAELDFDLTRQEWNRGWQYESLYTALEKTTNTREQGRLIAEVSHEHDRYAVAEKYRNISGDYSNSHMTVGDVKVKTSGDGSRSVFNYEQRFTFETECGNLLYLDWKGERVSREFNGKRAMMPADSLKSVRIKAINALPGNTKYGTRADEFVADSVVREVVYDLELTTVGLPQNETFHRELRDSFRVLLLAANEIVTAYSKDKKRDVIDESTEKCFFNEIFRMKDGSEHENPRSIVLTREIITKPEYEMIVKSFDFRHISDGNVVPGSVVSTFDTRDNWTVTERTDAFSGTASNNIESINTDYKFRHQGAHYKDEYLEEDFELISPTMAERSTWVEDATSPRGGYEAKRLQNTIQTSYLGYNQDAGESVLLLIEQAHETSQGWDKSKCTETVTDGRIDWHLEYVTNMSDGTSERVKFDFTDIRNVNCDSNWSSEEKDNTFTTSNVVVSLTNTENHSEEQNGARASWVREYRDMSAEVTLAASKQKNHWTSREANNFTCEYKGKTFSFEAHTLDATNADVLSAGNKEGDFMVYKYSDVLRYVWGNNIQNVTAPGVIKVKEATPEEETFFPPVWGRLLEAKQTVSNNVDHNGFVYVWSLHFEQGVLPVVVVSGSKRPEWHFEYFEYTSIHEYNSGTYLNGTWVNTIASDQFTQMTWGRGNQELANKDYSIAESQNWDEGRRVDGHTSVYTTRYNMQVEAGRLTVTDTYTGTYMGSWK